VTWIPPTYVEWYQLKRERDNLRSMMVFATASSFLLGVLLTFLAVLFID
jgi:hypothetical protein